jgi:hypothetical protein
MTLTPEREAQRRLRKGCRVGLLYFYFCVPDIGPRALHTRYCRPGDITDLRVGRRWFLEAQNVVVGALTLRNAARLSQD